MIKKWFGGDKKDPAKNDVSQDDERTVTVNKASANEDPMTLDVDKFRDRASSNPANEREKSASRPDSGKEKLSWPARDESRQARGMHESRAGDDEKTVLFNASKNRPEPSAAARAKAGADRSSDPVVGWVVIMQGPGKGHSVEIGAGANAIGRGAGQQIQLDFGDDKISRERHAIIVYEPEARQFFVQNGEVRNLTYVGGKVVLGAVELSGGETIRIGDTHLQFIPFCGPDFSWT
jgi:hypothetical protein